MNPSEPLEPVNLPDNCHTVRLIYPNGMTTDMSREAFEEAQAEAALTRQALADMIDRQIL